MKDSGDVTFTYSGILVKDNRPMVSVRFERESLTGKDVAEGAIPSCILDKVSGFSMEEANDLENYLRENTEKIMEEAKKLNHISNWFK